MFEIFGDLFDFNNDGKLDITERAAELGFIDEVIDEDENDDDGGEDDEW